MFEQERTSAPSVRVYVPLLLWNLVSTVQLLAEKSNAINYVDIDTRLPDLERLAELLRRYGRNPDVPPYYLRVAITEIEDASRARTSIGIDLPWARFTIGGSRKWRVVTLDMNLVESMSRRAMPGYSSVNSMVLEDTQGANRIRGRIENVATSASYRITEGEGMHAAIRALLQLGTIEIIGRLLRVPYEACLDSTAESQRRKLQNWYDKVTKTKRRALAWHLLSDSGYHPATTRRRPSRADHTRAIKAFQIDRGLVPTGAANFNLIAELLSGREDLIDTLLSWERDISEFPRPALRTKIGVELNVIRNRTFWQTDSGAAPTVVVKVDHPAYLLCFLETSRHGVVQVFPQHLPQSSMDPNKLYALQPANKWIPVWREPNDRNRLTERAGPVTQLTCVTSDRNLVRHLPRALLPGENRRIAVSGTEALLGILSSTDGNWLTVTTHKPNTTN